MGRWMCNLQVYSFEVKHRPGKCNGNADFLSRCPIEKIKEDIAVMSVTDRIMISQGADEECVKIMSYLRDGDCILEEDGCELERCKNRNVIEDTVLYHLWTPRQTGRQMQARKQLVVPKVRRGKVLVQSHEEAEHPRFQRMFARIRQNYFWKSMKRDITRHLQSCSLCAKSKGPVNNKHSPLKLIEVFGPLEHVGIEYVGLLPATSKGHWYVLAMQDQFLR